MKERPILFSAPMVCANLEGRKTVTRRIVKLTIAGRVGPLSNQWHIEDPGALAVCPYGQPGDRLWVKETFYAIGDVAGPPGSGQCWLHYRADKSNNLQDADLQWRGPWTSPLFMRRRYSRITLEVTGVRVERLQDGEGELDRESRYLAEGINRIHHGDGAYYYSAIRDEPHPKNWSDPFDAWRELWVSVNGIDSWNANPWVWVIEFKRVEAQTA